MFEDLTFLMDTTLAWCSHHRTRNAGWRDVPWRKVFVLYDHARDAGGSAENLAKHYLEVPLDAPFLQESHFGSSARKWTAVVNDDLNSLSGAVREFFRAYEKVLFHSSDSNRDKLAWRFFDKGATEYVAGRIERSDDYHTFLKHWCLNLDAWVAGDGWFLDVRGAPLPDLFVEQQMTWLDGREWQQFVEKTKESARLVSDGARRIGDFIASECSVQDLLWK